MEKKNKKRWSVLTACGLALACGFMVAGCSFGAGVNISQDQVNSIVETVENSDNKFQEFIDVVKESNAISEEKKQELIEEIENSNTISEEKLQGFIDAIEKATETSDEKWQQIIDLLNKEEEEKLTKQEAYDIVLYSMQMLDFNVNHIAENIKIQGVQKYGLYTNDKSESMDMYIVKSADGNMQGLRKRNSAVYGVIYQKQIGDELKYVNYSLSEPETPSIAYYDSFTFSEQRLRMLDYTADNIVNIEKLENGNISVTFYRYTQEQGEDAEYYFETFEINTDGLLCKQLYIYQYDSTMLNQEMTYTYGGVGEAEKQEIAAAIAEAEEYIAEQN